MNRTVIEVENLGKQYVLAGRMRDDTLRDQIANTFRSALRKKECRRTFWALQEASFTVREGEVVGIIGHNGAGKSTLLKILSRIVVPTRGCARIFGRIGSLLEVGTGFHPELTGRENIYLNGAIIGMRKEEIRRRFDEIVEFAEIGKFLDMPVKRYSSGMYVRLGFAVAAHLEPEILLLDEVLAVGDTAFQKKCLGKIGNVAKGGRTVLFVSHNMIAINSLCQRVIWVNGGKIADDGPAAQVVRKYVAASLTGVDTAEERWEEPENAPGNDQVRLHGVRVRRQDGRHSGLLTMETPFRVEVECWNLEPGARLHVTLHLYTAEGIIAFTTGSMNTRSLPAGLFRSTCYIPANLLNSGLHRFLILVVKDGASVICSYESRVPIEIVDVKERDAGYFGREPGVVQPLLRWSTEVLGETMESPVLPVGTWAQQAE